MIYFYKGFCLFFFCLFELVHCSYSKTIDSCYADTVGKATNLGLYGAKMNDLVFSQTTNRIFAVTYGVQSLFITDDTGKTWYVAFPYDSLEYNCDSNGWGGGGYKVLTNNKGWVLSYTKKDEEELITTVEYSNANGDTLSWKTFLDKDLFFDLGFSFGSKGIRDIELTDYAIYAVGNKYIIKTDSAYIDTPDILDVSQKISGITDSITIIAISAANNSSGFPYYINIDTSGNSYSGIIFKYDGNNFSQLTIPGNSLAYSVFVHPNSISGDTVFITALDTASLNLTTYRSFDAGLSWDTLEFQLTEIEKVKDWQINLPLSYGGILFYQGKKLSIDLGENWLTIDSTSECGTLSYLNPDLIAISKYNLGIAYSQNSVSGPFTLADNYNLTALHIHQIDRTADKNHFYLATDGGIAYTSAYNIDGISYADKWKSPYGYATVPNISQSASAIEINPWDSLHVLAGLIQGLGKTTTGPAGFTINKNFGFNALYETIKDIEFVSSDIIIMLTHSKAVGKSNYGEIYRSTDGGSNWIMASPSDFKNGNCIAITYGNADTTLFIGTGYHHSSSVVDTGYLWKSTDLGINWTKVNTGPSSIKDSSKKSLPIIDIAVKPGSKDTLYLVAGRRNAGAVVKSFDGGITYIDLYLDERKKPTSVLVNPTHTDSIYFGAGRSLLVYKETYNTGTDTANLKYRGLPGEEIPDMQSGSILVGTTTGFYIITIEPTTDTIVGIKNLVAEFSAIKIYPNPGKEEVTLEFNEHLSDPAYMYIHNMLGVVCYKQEITTHSNSITIPLQTLNLYSGEYILTICSANAVGKVKIMIIK